MTESDPRGAELLAAVCAEPEDLAARLVYADWLLERGDRRGELIRVQCELAAITKPRDYLISRERKLRNVYAAAIAKPLAGIVERAQVSRGFVEDIEIAGDALAEHGAEILAAHPIVKACVFVKNFAQFARLTTMPWVGAIPDVTYQGRRDNSHTAVIDPQAAIGTAMFARTRRLAFDGSIDHPPKWTAFYASVSAPHVVAHRPAVLDDTALSALASAPGFPALRALDLGWILASAAVPQVLARLAARPLREITLRNTDACAWSGPSVAAVISPTLRELTLFNVPVDGLVPALGERGERLEALTMNRMDIDLEELAGALVAGCFPALRSLDVTGFENPNDVRAREAFVAAVCAAPPTLAHVVWRSWEGESPATPEQRGRIEASGRTLA